MGKCSKCQGEFDYIPGIGICISCRNAMSSSSSNSYDSRKEAEAERAQDERLNTLTDEDMPPETEAPYYSPREAVTIGRKAAAGCPILCLPAVRIFICGP